ncbi:MAG: PEP-CTERM sorting domain-containing protein [Pacificimonas sp.]
MKVASLLTAALTAAALSSAASAVTILVDDFETATTPDPLIAMIPGVTAVSGPTVVPPNGFERTVSLTVNKNRSPGNSNEVRADVHSGLFDIGAESGVSYTTAISYSVGSFFADLPGTGATGTLDIHVNFADGNPRTFALELNGVETDSDRFFDFIDGSAAFPEQTRRLAFNVADLTGADVFTLKITGSAGFDTTLTMLEIDIPQDPAQNIPAPGALALMGLGLLGVASARRRKS